MSTTTDHRAAELSNLARNLETNLMLALSLGSKELFHSNLLGWFAEHDRAVGDALLDLWGAPGPTPVRLRALRERQHLDLVLHETVDGDALGPARVVVENKMFALPDPQQLDDYGPIIRRLRGDPRAVLLSLADPGWVDGRWDDRKGTVWHHHTYRSLAEQLAATVTSPESKSFQGLTLAHWIGLTRLLSDLGDLVGSPEPDEHVWLPDEVRRDLGRCRLDVPVQKLRAHGVASTLRNRRSDAGVDIKAGVAHGAGLVEAFVRVAENVEAGWQLQGPDWRMAVRFGPGHELHGRGDDRRAARERFTARSGWASFAHGPFADRPVGPRGKDGHVRFGGFQPDFVHRYVKVPDLTVAEVLKIGDTVIDQALELRDDPRWSQARA